MCTAVEHFSFSLWGVLKRVEPGLGRGRMIDGSSGSIEYQLRCSHPRARSDLVVFEDSNWHAKEKKEIIMDENVLNFNGEKS